MSGVELLVALWVALVFLVAVFVIVTLAHGQFDRETTAIWWAIISTALYLTVTGLWAAGAKFPLL